MVELAAPGTVDTAPEKTIEAVADHGVISGNTIAGPYLEARTVSQGLAGLGVDLTDVVGVLESQAVQKFEESWNDLLDTVRRALDSAGSTP